MKLKTISTVKNKAEAQSIAVAYQSWVSEQNLSYGELIKYNHYFEALGKKFKLTKEFKENGII